MQFQEISIYTLIPELHKIINKNNQTISDYFDSIFDASSNNLKQPIVTSGLVKGAKGEFITMVTDNLIVKKQYTNLYQNVSTQNYDWYQAYTSPIPDVSTLIKSDVSTWRSSKFSYIDVDRAYYKIKSDSSIAPRCNQVSQIVEFIIDSSHGKCNILLDPCGNLYSTIDGSAGENVQLMNVKWDASYGSYWVVTKTSGSGAKSWTRIIP